jgi:glycosyltransferase involved in cell wall biosynthesis
MASETPIILSDIPVFREVTEDKGIYFVIGDDNSLAEKIKLLDQNTEIRQSVIFYGNKRVQDFSFEKIAAQLKNLYREIFFELQ